jgi:HK97 family phage portal protein
MKLNFWPFRRKASSSYDLFREIYGGLKSSSGKTVTLDTAMQVSTVMACGRVIAEGISQVPLKLMLESGRTRVPAKKHHLYDVLSASPNSYQTSFEFRETIGFHAVFAGNAYVFKNVLAGKIRELIPIPPNKVTRKERDDGSVIFIVTGKDGKTKDIPEMMIWHVRGPSWDGKNGIDAIHLARDAIGLTMAVEESASKMQSNGVKSSGVYSVEGTLTAEQYKALQKWIKDNFEGSENAGSTMILDRNAKFLNTQMSGVDAQLLESRRFQIEEICRFFRVMPIMVGYSDKAMTYASSEQMFLAHVVHTLMPWYARLEQSIDANLLTPAERAAGYYSDFVEEGLLRGDMKTTSDVLVRYSTNGIMTRNEARAKLDMNPIDGLDAPLTPVNLMGDNTQTGDADAAQNA